MDGVNANYQPNISSNYGNSGGFGKGSVLNFYKDFKSTLAYVMTNLMNEDEDLMLDGMRIPAEHKLLATGTYALEEWKSDQMFILSQLLEAEKFEDKIANMANNIVASA